VERPGRVGDASIKESRRGATTWLTLDRPERLNAFTGAGYRELRLAVERAGADAATRVIVLTGSGRAFSAGADRSLVDGSASAADIEEAGIEFSGMLETIDACDKPILAAVNGLAVGIGCTLLLHCDLVLLAETARLRLPFTALGIVPEAGSSVLLPARGRWPDTLWAVLSSEWIDAPTALAMAIAWRVVPDAALVDETGRVAETIAALDPAAVAATKRLLTTGRAEAVQAAMAREQAEMRSLLDRRRRG
jgi:enoyl-CoA hydratase/carnithine racemase